MKIAVIDVAAERSGALSVLKDFHAYVYFNNTEHDWTFYTSVIDLANNENVHVIMKPWIKKSWLHRFLWEVFFTWQINRENYYDVVISLQNKAINYKKSIAYFHNMMLVQDKLKCSLLNKEDRLYAIYKAFVAPITMRSLRKADLIISQTETVKKQLVSKLKKNNIVVIPPQVKIDVRRLEIDINNCTNRNFFYPAVANKYKNHDIVVKAAWYLVKIKKVTDFNIYFTLDGNENEYSKKIFNMSKGLPQIKFIGYLDREDLFKMYYTHSLIITSAIESYPIPLEEAITIGTPIVAIGYDYVNEILKDYNRKYICLTNNYKDFADMMILSMNDSHHRNKPEKVINIHGNSIAQIIQEIEEINRNYR